MRIFRKSKDDVVNLIGRKSGIPKYNFGSKLDIGKKLNQSLDEYGISNQEEEERPRSDLERHRVRHHIRR